MIACSLCQVYKRPRPHRPREVGLSCGACLQLLDDELLVIARLHEIPDEALAPRGGGASSESARPKPGPRLPVSLDALALIGPGSTTGREGGALPPAFLLREWASAWAMLRALGVHGPKEYGETADGRTWLPVSGVPDLVAWLRQRLPWAADGHLFPRFAVEIHATAEALRRLAATMTGAVERQIGWCPGRTATGDLCLSPLIASTWADVIVCSGCATRYDRRRGDWETLVQALRSQGLTRQ